MVFCPAQNARLKKLESDADNHFRFDRNYEALKLYLELDSLRPGNAKITARIGICYLYHIKSRALPYLEKATEMGYKEDHLDYYLARAYHLNHQFEKASSMYATARTTLKSKLVRQDVDLFIKNCADAKKLMSDSVNVKIENLGATVNTVYPEYAPVISADESTLIYTSERPSIEKKNKRILFDNEDIYISHKENNVWTKGENMGGHINSDGNDASIGMTMDGEEIFIYKSDSLNPSGGHIFVSKKDGDSWTYPVRLNSNINTTNGWEPSITVGPEEDVLFFTSNRPGGFGGLDIYVSKRIPGGDWGPAKNLGPVINTPYDEDAPFIHPDGHTLYFSTKGHPSIGGYDIYTTTYFSENDSVTPPVNLGYPINTADDELFFIWSADGTRGYFASTREDSYGRSDIYMITRPKVDVNLILFSGNVTTEDDRIVPAIIKITDNETNKLYAAYDSTKFKGKYAISLKPGKNYAITVEAKDFLTYSENINIPVNGFHDIRKDIRLVPLGKGGLIVLKNVLFEPGKSGLNENAVSELERYSQLVKEHPDLTMEIAGHAFDLEDHKSNLELSEKRARAVVDYLVSKGANPANLRPVGYGDRFRVAGDDKSLNTRTEVILQQTFAKDRKEEISKGYYYQDPDKAVAQSAAEVSSSINAKLRQDNDYLIPRDEDVYISVNSSRTLKDLRVNEEVREKVREGTLLPVLVKGKVKDKETGSGLSAVVHITDHEGKLISETRTSEEGDYAVEVYNNREKKYTITIQAKGYTFTSKNITAPANGKDRKELINNFSLSSLVVGSPVVLRNIYFDNNTATLRKESYKELKKLEVLLKKNPGVRLEISGYTDDKGSGEYNKSLSKRRAETVVRYLVQKGIAPARLIARGYGEERPLASNDDEQEGRELNRRIEFKVLEK